LGEIMDKERPGAADTLRTTAEAIAVAKAARMVRILQLEKDDWAES
jgi:hypothetical protein